MNNKQRNKHKHTLYKHTHKSAMQASRTRGFIASGQQSRSGRQTGWGNPVRKQPASRQRNTAKKKHQSLQQECSCSGSRTNANDHPFFWEEHRLLLFRGRFFAPLSHLMLAPPFPLIFVRILLVYCFVCNRCTFNERWFHNKQQYSSY